MLLFDRLRRKIVEYNFLLVEIPLETVISHDKQLEYLRYMAVCTYFIAILFLNAFDVTSYSVRASVVFPTQNSSLPGS